MKVTLRAPFSDALPAAIRLTAARPIPASLDWQTTIGVAQLIANGRAAVGIAVENVDPDRAGLRDLGCLLLSYLGSTPPAGLLPRIRTRLELLRNSVGKVQSLPALVRLDLADIPTMDDYPGFELWIDVIDELLLVFRPTASSPN